MWMDLLIEGIRPLPGRHVTGQQMRFYMKFRQTEAPPVAAAKASISTATAYRFEQDRRLQRVWPSCGADAARARMRINSFPQSMTEIQ
jgi:hypothetical protein